MVAKKVSPKKLLRKGIVVTVGANEPAAFEFEIAAAAKSARLAQVGDLIVSAKQIAIGGGQRSVKLTIAKRFRKALRPSRGCDWRWPSSAPPWARPRRRSHDPP